MAANIYVGQTAIELIFNTSTSLAATEEIVLHAKSPTGILKTFDVEVVDAANGIVRYVVESDEDFDEAGMWIFYISVIYDNDKTNVSEPAKIMFNEVSK